MHSPQTAQPPRARDLCLTFSGNRLLLLQGHGLRCGPQWQHRPRGITGYSPQAIRHYPGVFSSAFLHCAHIFLFLFLFHFSTTSLHLLVARGVFACPRLSPEWTQVCYGLHMPYGARQGTSHIQHGLCFPLQVVISG